MPEGEKQMKPQAEDEIIPVVEPEETMEKFLARTKSGKGGSEVPEKARGSGASGTTDEARDIGV